MGQHGPKMRLIIVLSMSIRARCSCLCMPLRMTKPCAPLVKLQQALVSLCVLGVLLPHTGSE